MTCFYDVPKVDTSFGASSDYKPLPSTVTDYIAEILCGILEIQQQPSVRWDSIPLPELLFFIQKVTKRAHVDVKTAIASLVLVMRFKKRLPKAAHGGYGTYHKIFLTSLLIALKEFMPKTKEEEEEEKEEFEESLDSNTTDDTNNKSKEISNAKDINNVDSDTNSNLSVSPSSSIISTTPTSTTPSDDEQEDDMVFRDNSDLKQPSNDFNYKLKRPIINKKLCGVISDLYNEEEVERMEREFMWRINGEDKVTDKDIRDYVETNRHALGICE